MGDAAANIGNSLHERVPSRSSRAQCCDRIALVLQDGPGFFAPRHPSTWLSVAGAQSATSYYDTAPLRETLLELVDFSLINEKAVRLAAGAVSVIDGNFVYFDNARDEIGPEHAMASGALPPMVKIGTDHFWDGGIVSSTPLQHSRGGSRSSCRTCPRSPSCS